MPFIHSKVTMKMITGFCNHWRPKAHLCGPPSEMNANQTDIKRISYDMCFTRRFFSQPVPPKSEHMNNICHHKTCSEQHVLLVHKVCQGDRNACVSMPPKEYSADVKGGGGQKERKEQMCCSEGVGGGGASFGLIRLRQVAAHVKPLSADSNDTGQELLTGSHIDALADVHICNHLDHAYLCRAYMHLLLLLLLFYNSS